MSSATGHASTKTTPVMNTGFGGGELPEETCELGALKGFRKRWALKGTASEATGSNEGASNLFGDGSEPDMLQDLTRQCFEPMSSDIDVRDASVDETSDGADLSLGFQTSSHIHMQGKLY